MRVISQQECAAVYGGDCEDVGEFASGFTRSLLTAAGAAAGAYFAGAPGAIAGAAIGSGIGAAVSDEVKQAATQVCESHTASTPSEVPPPREPDPNIPEGGGYQGIDFGQLLLVPQW